MSIWNGRQALVMWGALAVVSYTAVASAAPAPTAPAKPAAKVVAAPAKAAATQDRDAANALATVRVLLKASREARISSQINGRITALPLKMGQSFQKGALLVGFECSHQEADKAAAEALVVKMEKTLATKKQLAAMSAAPEIDAELAAADLAQARAQLNRARASVADCKVIAPYNGSVVRVVANHAESVSPGSPLIEIVESGNLYAEALVSSSWLTWLKTGTRFTVKVDELGGKEVEATVSAIGARVDPVSQTIPITGRIIQMVPGLRAGMSGNAQFVNKP